MNIYLIGIVVSIIFGIVAYISSNNFIVMIIVLAFSLMYFMILASKQVKKFNTKIDRFHECYFFINNFIISLSIKGSLKAALESVRPSASNELKEVFEGITTLPDFEIIVYLQRFFQFHIYKLFVDLLVVWQEEGGDILNMSNYLISQSRLIEEYINKIKQMNRSKIFEFITLWLFALLILIVLRFALSQFYDYLVKRVFYHIGIVVIFAFALLSIHILLLKISNVDIGGWNDEK